jgi:hypothetical protein
MEEKRRKNKNKWKENNAGEKEIEKKLRKKEMNASQKCYRLRQLARRLLKGG